MLLAFDGGAGKPIRVGDPAWWQWLDAPSTTHFRFEQGADGFTARRERREGGWYWYAYRKRAGRLHKAYLGRVAELTADRLRAVALALAQRAGEHSGEQPRFLPSRASRRDVRRHNFPEHPTSFVGREQALSDMRRLLETTRLLTATGPGGVGKSRLALQVAIEVLGSYPDGAWLVELAALADPRLVPHTLSGVLGIRERPGQDLLEALSEALRDRRLLLVLDNCEHLVHGCAQLADGLLRRCPDVRILATSRTVLDVAGETAWRVPSLGLPSSHGREALEQVARSEAIQLFVERAQAARPGFVLDARSVDAVTTICQRLDGLPLAIELAAALVRVLDPQQIAEHLDQALSLLTGGPRPAAARQQTLRATLDWSYKLLSDRERRLFEQVSVFAGGWTLEAAEAVCAGELTSASDVLDLLRHLVDQSLVVAEPGEGAMRFHLLETLRQYAAERLDARGETERVRCRHAAYYATWAEQLGDAHAGPQHTGRRASFQREHDNVRAALRWLIDHGEAEHAQRLSGAAGSFWQFGGRTREGRTWLDQVRALPDGNRKTTARVRMLNAAAALAIEQADFAVAGPLLEAALELGRELSDRRGIAVALFGLAHLAWSRREFALARTLATEGAVTSRAAGARELEARNRWQVAQAAFDLDDPSAGTLAEQALAVSSAAEDPGGLARALTTLGQIHLSRGELGSARAALERALALHPKGEVHVRRMWMLANLGWVATEQGDLAMAQTCFLDALVMARDALGGRARLAMPVDGLAQVAAAMGRSAQAFRLAGAAAALRETQAVPPTPTERAQLDRWLSRARAGIGARAADAAWAAGRRLTADEVVAEALAVDVASASPARPGVGQRTPGDALTTREREVAMLVAEGLGTRQIAEQLVIAEGTVRVHVERILSKLGLHSRMQLAAWAVQRVQRDPASTPAH